MNTETPIDLRADLFALAARWRLLKANPGAWLAEEFVARKGIECKPRALPASYRLMMPKACYANAARLVSRRRNLRYCEGFAMRPGLSSHFAHAWAIDAEDRVIDPTWSDPADCLYLGYPVTLNTLKADRAPYSTSLLSSPVGVNFKFIIRECPELWDLMTDESKAVLRPVAEAA